MVKGKARPVTVCAVQPPVVTGGRLKRTKRRILVRPMAPFVFANPSYNGAQRPKLARCHTGSKQSRQLWIPNVVIFFVEIFVNIVDWRRAFRHQSQLITLLDYVFARLSLSAAAYLMLVALRSKFSVNFVSDQPDSATISCGIFKKESSVPNWN